MLKRFYSIGLFLLIICTVPYSGNSQPLVNKSLFASGRWVKIETTASGIHKIESSWLKNAGFLHPENVRLYGSQNSALSRWNAVSAGNRPVQLPLLRYKEASGNESLLFFVQGDVSLDYDKVTGQYYHERNQSAGGKSYFYLTENAGAELTHPIADQPTGSPNISTSTYDDFSLWEEENLNLLESGSLWFTGLIPGGASVSKSFSFQDRLENEAVKFKVHAAGRSASPTGMALAVNGNVAGNILFHPIQPAADTDFAALDSIQTSLLLAGSAFNLSLRYNGGSSDQCWLDFATIQLRRSLSYRGAPLIFRDGRTVGSDKIVEYKVNGATAGLLVWEITNPLMPCRIVAQISNGQLTFKQKSDSLRSFILFDPQASYPVLTISGEVKNVDIITTDVPQYLIIAPAAFLTQAERLAHFHRQKSGLTVKVVSTESIFNEIAGGYADISALRDYIRLLYQLKKGPDGSTLKYLLLLGKGTCDPVHNPGESNPNWIPTWQSENSVNSINSYVSDDFFGLLDPGEGEQTGDVDVGIGRIPAATLTEATISVDKIIHYHDAATLGDWRNNISFIGDDEDNNLHVNDSERLAGQVNRDHPEFNTSRIYLDAYPQILTPEERYPEVTEAIRRSVQTGQLVVNYIGHASEDGLAHERILTSRDIDSWTNKDRLPLFVTATCEFSRWDMTVKRSAGEHLCFHQAGGAIALLSATRLVYSSSNFEINKSFFNHVFDRDEEGKPLRLGDLIRMVKNEQGGSINAAKFCLLGDPALRLNFPENSCKNLLINNQSVDQFNGILSPSTLVTITGEIRDRKGNKLEQYGGTISAQVLDQPTMKATLGNGGNPSFNYRVQENFLFKGMVPVKSGTFTYSFVVPKDVNFNNETGLIRYYFDNGTSDGNGSYAGIHFNGTDNLPATDKMGPEIRLFLENETFREGATVSSNPLLMVYLSDESGINTTGFGIGHDITIELDGNTSDRLVLNEFYRSDPATWKTGALFYPLSSLTEGLHTLTFRVWDTLNNSSLHTVGFKVGSELTIEELYNYPNPFSDQTRFVISHNRYDELMTVDLEVMDIAGRVLHRSQQLLPSRGYEVNDFYWDPGSSGHSPSNGVYIYRVTLTDQAAQKSRKAGRMILKK